MARVGYQRVSSAGQNTERQDLGEVDKLFTDRQSGKDTKRPELQAMLEYVRDGDAVVVHSIDRLARDLRDLQDIVTTLNDKGVAISFLSEGLIFDPSKQDALATLQLQMMGSFAQFERNIIRKRQAEGIAKAKERGVYQNRTPKKPTISRDQVKALRDQGLSTYKIAAQMGISRMSVHRILKEQA
jgi:DNA invertase Pin-like site-specific DNA recombinase